MYILKGFVTRNALISNIPDVVSTFGELSSDGLSYAKDKLLYTDNAAAPQTTLVVFHTVMDGQHTIPTADVRLNALTISNFLYSRSIGGQVPNDGFVLRQQLNAEFTNTASDFTVGLIKEDGGNYMPEYITYRDLSVVEPAEITLWFSDTSFRAQYDLFEIEVVPPFVPYDDFFLDPNIVKTKLFNYDFVEKTNEVQRVRGEYPYTQLKTYRYDYYNPVDQNDRTPSYWQVITYGQAGNNPDLIREAIVEEVLANSDHDQEEWAEILPDLFKTTEMIFTPMWTRYSVPNHQFHAGIYSPTIDPREATLWAKRTARGNKYTPEYVDQRVEFSFNVYKSLAMAVLGNPENRDGITQFSDLWPEYMATTNDSPDFNRMSVETMEFSVLLSRLIVTAESMTQYSALPQGLARVIRDGVIYAVGNYRNINYLVVAKHSAEQLFL